MRSALVVALVAGLALTGCARSTDAPHAFAAPAAPTAVGANTSPSSADLPFRSEIVWTKTEGSEISLCTHPLPAGKVYLMRNHQTGTAVTTHLGAGEFEGHTCVYGATRPEGWFGEWRWTAANGDVLLATSEFQYWTGVPGKSIAVDTVTFQDGGTGRFLVAEGEGMAYVNAPARTAVFEGLLRYGRKEK